MAAWMFKIKGLQSFKISELLPQWHRIKWTAISRLLWYRASKSNISCDVWYRPYLSKYKKIIFSYSIIWKTKDNLKHVHKVTCSVPSWKCKILKRDCLIYKSDLHSGTHSKYRNLIQYGQRQQVLPKHQYKYQTTSHLLVFGWRRTQQRSWICLLCMWRGNDRYLFCYTCNLISLSPHEWLTLSFLLERFTGQKLTNYLHMRSQPWGL